MRAHLLDWAARALNEGEGTPPSGVADRAVAPDAASPSWGRTCPPAARPSAVRDLQAGLALGQGDDPERGAGARGEPRHGGKAALADPPAALAVRRRARDNGLLRSNRESDHHPLGLEHVPVNVVPLRRAPASSPAAAPDTSTEAWTDAQLVLRARAGEREAAELLLERHLPMVHGVVSRLIPRDPELDDLIQDVLLQALDGLSSLREPASFGGWLRGIAVHVVHNRLRRRTWLRRLGVLGRAEPTDLDTVIAPTAPPDVQVELRAVYAVIERLGPDARVALLLSRVEGMKLEEIGRVMGLSLATVKRRLLAAEREVAARMGGAP